MIEPGVYAGHSKGDRRAYNSCLLLDSKVSNAFYRLNAAVRGTKKKIVITIKAIVPAHTYHNYCITTNQESMVN